jgi:hypothetical protein
MENEGKIATSFSEASHLLARDGWKIVGLQFDDADRQFEIVWNAIHEEFRDRPQEAPIASKKLIDSQPLATSLVLAMVRLDSVVLFVRFKRFLESLLGQAEKLSGYPAIVGIPHVQAGFLYMTAFVMALHWESWQILEKLLTAKFEWYYQSGRSMFSFPFDLPYFFHSEPFDRNATKIHDFFRKELARTEIATVTGLAGERAMDAYVQAQMLMCLKVAQLNESGESARIWPDFGRFYGNRVIRLLDRTYEDNEFAQGLLRAFGEDKETFFAHLNERLSFIHSEFWQGAPFFYESLSSWEPRGTHA